MTPSNLKAVILAALVAATASGASAQTLGERISGGTYSKAAFAQLIAGTGLSVDEAQAMTFEEVAKFRATDD
jgi:hypothetical protein